MTSSGTKQTNRSESKMIDFDASKALQSHSLKPQKYHVSKQPIIVQQQNNKPVDALNLDFAE